MKEITVQTRENYIKPSCIISTERKQTPEKRGETATLRTRKASLGTADAPQETATAARVLRRQWTCLSQEAPVPMARISRKRARLGPALLAGAEGRAPGMHRRAPRSDTHEILLVFAVVHPSRGAALRPFEMLPWVHTNDIITKRKMQDTFGFRCFKVWLAWHKTGIT